MAFNPFDNPFDQPATASQPFDNTPLGKTVNFFAAVPESTYNVGKSFLQGLFRIPAEFAISAGQAGVGIADKIFGTNNIEQATQPIPTDGLSAFLGSEPLKGYGTQVEDFAKSIENSDFAKKIGLDKHAWPLAFAGVVGSEALNFIGGEENAVKQIAKENNPAVIAKLLVDSGVDTTIAEKTAPHLAQTTDPREVQSTLDTVKGMQATLKNAPEGDMLSGEPTSPAAPSTQLPADAQERYMQTIQKEYNGADNVLSADSAKSVFPEYNGANAETFHDASSDFVKNDLYDKWLTEKKGTKNNTVLFTAGGTGSGKTTALLKNGIDIRDYPIVYDGNFASAGAIERAKKALEAGYDVQIVYVHRDPAEAFKNGVIPRATRQGRVVPIEQHIQRHELSLPNVIKAQKELEKYGSKAEIIAIDNTRGPGEATVSTLDNLPKFGYNKEELKNELYAATQQATKEGGLTAEQSASILGEKVPQTDGAGIDGQPQQERAGGQGDVALGEPRVSVGQGTQAPRIEDTNPKVIRDLLPTPNDAIAKLAKEPDAKSWQSLVKGYMYNAAPEKKVHLLDYLATPEFVLEKVGLGKGAEMLHDAQDVYRTTLKKEIEKVDAWKARASGPDAKRIIFQYLDGREKDVVREMTPEEHAVAKEIRDYLQQWADRLHLPEDNQISRYITHIFERDIKGKDSFVDPEMAAIMSENVAKSVYDRFLQKRTGKPGYIEDVWRALDAYVKRASRKEAMDPALEELSRMAEKLDQQTYNYVKTLSHRVNLRPTELEQAMDNLIKQTPIGYRFTERPTAYLSRALRQIFYRGTLGLNFSSALRNLTQGANTYAKLGEKYTAVGYSKLLFRMASRNLDELFEHGVLSDNLIQDRNMGVGKKAVQAMDKTLFSVFQFAEQINRGAAYFGAKAKALNKGLSEEEAIKFAKRMVRETQFAFGSVDTPVALNDDVVKTLAQLQTYNIKQAEFLGRMVKQKDFLGVMRFSAASIGMLYSIGRLIGMTPQQLIPTIGIGGAPLTSTAIAIPELFSSDAQTRAKGKSQLQRNLMTLIPSGGQIRKTIQGAQAIEKGKDTTATGKFRFRVDSDPATVIRTLLFGKNTLPQAQDYFGSVGKKKTTGAAGGNPFDQ